MADVVKKLTITSKVEGATQTQSDLKGIATAYDQVASSAQKTATVTDVVTRRGLSTAEAYRRQTLALDETARAQDKIAKATKVADENLKQGNITQEAHAARLNLIKSSYDKAAVGIEGVANASKLGRYELINLSRQFQDVGVSLASGQSFFTVAIQQGSQIADVFLSSQGTIKGFFSQVGTAISTFLTPMRLAVGGVTAFATGIAFAAQEWSSGQIEIRKALSGIGAASGVTRDQINQIGTASSSAFGLSGSEARAAATAYASTGKIYAENTRIATDATKDFARAMGVDVVEAQKQIAKGMLDPVAGAQEWNKTLGFLNASTLNYIRGLQAVGDEQGAQKALLEAAAPSIRKMADNTSLLSKMWDAAANDVSRFFSNLQKGAARDVERLTGADLGGFSDQERLVRARGRLTGMQTGPFQGPLAQPGIKAQTEEVARLEANLKKAAEAAGDTRFAQFSLQADAAVRALVPQVAQTEALTKALADLNRVRDRAGGRADPQLGIAAQSGTLQLAQSIEAENVEARRVKRVSEISAEYQNVSIATALALDKQKDQLAIAEAVTGQQKLAANELAASNALLDRGVAGEEAMRLAAGARAIAQAEINTQVQTATLAMKEQQPVAEAVTGAQRIQAEGAALTAGLLRQNVDAYTAQAAGAQQVANAQAQVNANAQATLLSLQDQVGVAGAMNAQEKISAQFMADYNQLLRDGVNPALAEQVANMKASVAQAAEMANQARQYAAETEAAEARRHQQALANQQTEFNEWMAFRDRQRRDEERWIEEGKQRGGRLVFGGQFADSQGVPNKYQSTIETMAGGIVRAMFGGGATVTGNQIGVTGITPSSQGWEFYADRMIKSGKSIVDAIDNIIKTSRTFGGLTGDTSQTINTLLDLVPEESRPGVLRKELEEVMRQPVSLAREELIKQLNDSLKQLTDATNGLNVTLDPLFTGGHQALRIGFYNEGGGGGSRYYQDTAGLPTATGTRAPAGTVPTGYNYLHAATGWEGMVTGGSGNDDVPFHAMVSRGERISITPPGQPAGKATVINVVNNWPRDAVGDRRRTYRQMSEGFSGIQSRAN